MGRPVASPLPWLLLAAASLLAGCGYSTQLTVATEYGSIDTVGVEIFGNDTLERDLERAFHAELSNAVRDFVDARLVSPRHADVVLRGTMTQFARRGGIRSEDNELLQTGILMAVEASLVDRVSDEPLSGPMEISVDVGYALTGIGMEADARGRALHNLAERVALDLFTAAAIRESDEEAPESDLLKSLTD